MMNKLFVTSLAGVAFALAPAYAGECAEKAAAPEGEAMVADSFSFGVEREMKESGEKGGTEDINIGVGELQEGEEAEDKPVRAAKSKKPARAAGASREMKESGEKGGTEDINIGVGELQECTISK